MCEIYKIRNTRINFIKDVKSDERAKSNLLEFYIFFHLLISVNSIRNNLYTVKNIALV